MNVGPWELLVILIIGILVIGPQRMVEVARTIGRVVSQLRKFSSEFTSTLQAEIMASEREAKQVIQDVENTLTMKDVPGPIASLQDELLATERETRQLLENITKTINKDDPDQEVE
ncbi:MAG: twin-arginine translocase TatA/TatE family subunit [Chloroflexota bacterium]|nr:twin-arginine translocase TatA/TatE family subunit [Chloroflexota bacterium]